jgi:hypothetical protein
MPKNIIDALSLSGGHTRSAALDRDLRDPAALASYMLTPAAAAALKQIGNGLAEGGRQRAWKVVGPYGSGKTALSVLLGQLVSGRKAFPAAHRLLSASAPRLVSLFEGARRYPLAVVGSRSSIGLSIAAAVAEALRDWRSKPAIAMRRSLELPAATYQSQPLNACTGALMADLAQAAKAEGYTGVLLLVDEVGKFIEHAALRPDEGDLIALQQIAEGACTPDDDKLAVVVMLHQHFASYAAGVGKAVGDEWHKIASRFDEVAFDEPLERYAHFAAHALKVKPAIRENASVVASANDLYATARKQSLLHANSDVDRQLFAQAEQLYPLHPLTLAALAVVSKRYGQSERSFHAFLRGTEPFGLLDFVQRHEIDARTWFRVPELFDYLSHGYGLRFRDLAAERRWAFATAAIGRQEFDDLGLRVLKSVAVLELLGGGLSLQITPKLIAFAIGEQEAGVASCCDVLKDQSILLRRGADMYGFAVSDAVNIEAVYEKVARAGEEQLAIAGLSHALSQRLIVANKHYDETGTIRTMAVIAGSPTSWPKQPKAKTDELQPDAWVKLILAVKDSDAERQAREAVKAESDQLTVSAVLPLLPESRAALAEYAVWLAVQREVDHKRLDPWTSQYVGGRVQAARESIELLVLSQLMPAPDRLGPQYWYQGKPVQRSELMNLSQLSSWLFSKVYSASPRIINELINKDRPPSAIVLARQRMFEVILGGDPSRPIAGPGEYPPERLIHYTLLKQTGLWMEESGRWRLTEPTTEAPIDITHVWQRIAELLRSETPPTFQALLDDLAGHTLGIRNAPAGIWIVMYLLVRRSQCAIFERGTLTLEITNEVLQRLYKNPSVFELRELSSDERSVRVLQGYRTAIGAIGSTLAGELTVVEVARSLYRWWARLPEFSQQTARISKEASLVRTVIAKAQDPIELLTASLPKQHREAKSKGSLADWLTGTLSELGMAHRKLHEQIAHEISVAFEMSGPLSRIRNQLQAECANAASELADARLKSFILRCTDLSLTDEKWVDSLASLIVHRPLDAWVDDTIARFTRELSELCGQYKRWLRLVSQRGRVPRAAERFVGVTLTMASGQESSVFFAASEASAKVAREISVLVKKAARGDAQLAASALAQALLDLNEVAAVKQEPEASDDERKAG